MPFPTAQVTGIWLSAWAFRSRANLDYKLSSNARLVRWGVVMVCFSLAPRASSAAVRVSVGLIGLAVLCWPNFAYHLTSLFEKWPTTEGRVSSTRQSGSRWCVDYYFDFNNEGYGGTSKFKPISSLMLEAAYPEGAVIAVRFDPLNPERSRLVPIASHHHPLAAA